MGWGETKYRYVLTILADFHIVVSWHMLVVIDIFFTPFSHFCAHVFTP